MQDFYDVTIVGGGPAGMFAAFYAGLRELKGQLIESLPQLGGQVSALYPEKDILDIAGFANVTGQQLIDQLTDQMAQAPIETRLNETVEDVVRVDGGFKVVTNKRTSYSKTVLIALGNGAFSPRKLAVDNTEQFEEHQIFYAVTHKEDFRNQRVLVAGGGDAAIDMALMLEPVASEVHLMHRREKFRGLEHEVTRLKQSSVQLELPYLLKGIDENADHSLHLTMKKMRSEDEKALDVDDVVVSYGFTSDNKALTSWSLDLAQERHDIVVDSTMQTSEPGVFAIGDGVNFDGKVKLIASAFGEAPTAISSVAKLLYPDRHAPVHSTSLASRRKKDAEHN